MEGYPLLPLPGQVYNSPNNSPTNNVKPNIKKEQPPRTKRHDDPLLGNDTNINEERKNFFVKCREGNLEEVKKYIYLYPDFIDDRDDEDSTCLLWAGWRDNSAVVEYLIRKGADINAINKKHNSLLHVAARIGNLELVRFLVDDKGFDINKQNINDATPLHFAVFWAKKDIVDFLINKGANLYLKDKEGYIPYHFTSYKRNLIPGEVLFKGVDSSKKESLINDLKSIEKMLKDAMDKSPPQGGSRKSQSRRQRKRKSRTRKVRR